jgi:uncharacterized protein (TIGR00251 family)
LSAPLPPWLRRHAQGWLLALHVQPGAKRTEVAGPYAERLKLRLQAPPVDGKANAALLAFLADRIGTARSAVQLLRGETARDKDVLLRVPERTAQEITDALGGATTDTP